MVRLTDGALRDLQTLLDSGSPAGLTDGQLLERFATGEGGSAEAAVAAMVERHGPMVLRLCRRVLRDPHDAEDASQAVFLVLARRARSIRKSDSVASWLFGVACRVAAQARGGAARRRLVERRGAEMVAKLVDEGDRPAEWPELYEELARLPEKLRAPLVLCYLEGLTHEQAAGQLRWPLRTVRSRLVAGRDRIRGRLLRRGATLAAGLLGAGDATRVSAAAMSPGWVAGTVRAAMQIHAGKAAVGATVTSTAVALADAAIRRTIMIRYAWGSAALLSVAATFAAVLATDDGKMNAPAKPTAAATALKDAPREGTVAVHGRVNDPDGKPVAGARIYLGPAMPINEVLPPPPLRARTGPDGSFGFEVARGELAKSRPLAALADGFGPAWSEIDAAGAAREQTLGLARDDVPLIGRVIGLEGQPVAGANVHVLGIMAPPGGNLVAWLKAGESKPTQVFWPEQHRHSLNFAGPGPLPTAVSDTEGRFRLVGIGRDRIAIMEVRGAQVANEFATAVTRSDRGGPTLSLPAEPGFSGKLDGPEFTIMTTPGRPVVGVIRDRDTNQPIAGVKVTANSTIEAVSDAQGRYRLVGLPKSDRNGRSITTETPGQSYLKTVQVVPDTPGLGPIGMDLILKRGVRVEGRVKDGATGRPVAGVTIEYFPLRDNPAVAEVPGYSGLNNNVSDEATWTTDADGRYRAVALSGRGILAVRAKGYRTATPLAPADAGNVLDAANFQYQMYSYQGFVSLDVPSGTDRAVRDISLTPGVPIHGEVVGPDGTPVAGCRAYGLEEMWFPGSAAMRGSTFTYPHPNPGTVETLTFIHEAKRLGAAIDLKGDKTGPVRVALTPTGVILGRLVDVDGRPRSGVILPVLFPMNLRGNETLANHIVRQVTTDRDGRFRVDLMVPGVKYQILVAGKNNPNGEGYVDNARSTVTAGQTKDLGDVREKKIGGN